MLLGYCSKKSSQHDTIKSLDCPAIFVDELKAALKEMSYAEG